MDPASLYNQWADENGKEKSLEGFETWKKSFITVLSADPSAPYQLELTPLADLTPQQLVTEKMGLKPMPREKLEQILHKQMMEKGLRGPLAAVGDAWPDRLGASIDFRKHPYKPLTPVKNQVNCGSCYLFGCVAALECFLSINVLRGPLPASIAVQPLLSCSVGRGYGCAGGEQYTTCEQILAPCFKSGGGVYTETAMPYVFLNKTVADECDFQIDCAERMSLECRVKGAKGTCNACMPACAGKYGSSLLGCAMASDPRRLAISANVRTQIIPFPGGLSAQYDARDKVYYDTLKTFGPFPVSVVAGITTNSDKARKTVNPWPLYKTGFLTPPTTAIYDSSSPVNHLILLVGATPYSWICRNSWNTTWGEGGYFYIPRGKQWGSCGAWGILSAEPIVFIL